MIELYTHPMSPCAQKVRITLAEKGLAWTKHHVDLQQKENLKPEYLKLNPLGVVPTLVDNGQAIIESSLICEYLDEQYPETQLRPADALLRSKIRYWMKHVDVKLHPSCGTIQWPMVMREALMAKPEAERNALLEKIPEKPRRERQKRLVKFGLDAPDVVDAVRTYYKTIQLMDQALVNHQWLVSDEFTLADVVVAPYFQTLQQFDWIAMFDGYPRVADWFERVQARASYQEAVAADFAPDLLAQLQEKGRGVWHKIDQHLAPLKQTAKQEQVA